MPYLCPLAGLRIRTAGSGNGFAVAAGPAAFLAAVVLFPVPKADKLPAAAVAGQPVWPTAAGLVLPCGAATGRAERFPLFARDLGQRFAAIFTAIRIQIWYGFSLDAATAADGFYGVGGE